MSLGLDVRKDLLNLSVLVDKKRSTGDAHHFLPVHILLFEHTVRYGRRFIHVAEERKGQIVLGLESRLSTWSVGRNAEYNRGFLVELLDCVTKLVSFCGSARRVGTREEIQHHLLPLELRQLERLVGVGLKFYFGSFVAFFEHGV